MTDNQKKIQAYDPNEEDVKVNPTSSQESVNTHTKADREVTDDHQFEYQEIGSKKKNEDSLQDLDVASLPKRAFAGIWPRTFAYLIDVFFIHLIQRLVYNLTIYRFLGSEIIDAWWLQLLDLIIFVAYFALTSYYLKGQTLGKVLLGLRVIQVDGSSLSRSRLLVREIAGKLVIKSIPIVTVFLVFDLKRRHVMDRLCDTLVIDEKQVKMLVEYQAL